MTAVLIRICLRYAAAALVARGVISHDISDTFVNDPDVATALNIAAGGLLGVVAEFWYFLAHRLGWQK